MEVGPLIQDQTQVIGVENSPIFVDGGTARLPLEWREAVSTVSFLVVPTLIELDVILGLDLLQRLGVKIDTKAGVAEPTVMISHIQPLETWRVHARKSVVFQVKNPFPGKDKNVLFEPSEKLPAAIRGTTSLGQGEKVYVRLENTGEEELIINSDWKIGTMEVVEEEPGYPRGEAEEAGLPPVAEELTTGQKKKKKKKKKLRELLQKFKDVFKGKDFKLGNTDLIEHEIHTEGSPIRQPYRRQKPEVQRHEQDQLKEMLEQEVIRPSCSPWASPVVMVKKKGGTLRFCIDFRKLNDVTIKDAHPLPRIYGTDSLKRAKLFSTLNLKFGYWQMPIKKEHKSKMTFRTSSGQLYEFNRLPFGLCNAPATFSRLMDNILSELSWEVCLHYLDNIVVFLKDWDVQIQQFCMVFQRLREANLWLEHKKCTLAKASVTFLGHLVSEEGLQLDPRLLESIQEIQLPSSVAQVRSFLGLIGYYRRFIKGKIDFYDRCPFK